MATMKEQSLAMKNHVLTGISYIFPLLVVTQTAEVIVKLLSPETEAVQIMDLASGQGLFQLLIWLSLVGKLLIYPLFSGFIAFSIADKIALVPGLLSGLLVYSLNGGFVGSLIIGLIAGYICLLMKEKLQLPQALAAITPVFLVPLLGSLTSLVIYYVLASYFGAFNTWLESSLNGSPLIVQVLIAVVFGGMIGYDIGGPVNKLGVTVAFALLTSQVYYVNTAVQLAIIVPPIGVGISTFIAKKRYSKAEQIEGKNALFMGITGISEGAIPFQLKNPRQMTRVNSIGSALASGVGVAFGAVNQLPLSGFYAWVLIDNLPMYLLSLLIGVMFVALGSLWQRPLATEGVTDCDESEDEEEDGWYD